MTEDSYGPLPDGESIFTVPGLPFKFGPGALDEVGDDALQLGIRRAVLVTDSHVVATGPFERYDADSVGSLRLLNHEPTDE